MKKYSIFSIFICALVSSLAYASGGEGGEHHASIKDLIPPTANFIILASGLIFILRKKLSALFEQKSKDVAEAIERADRKYKESQEKLSTLERKVKNLDEEVRTIKENAERDKNSFAQVYSEECRHRAEKVKSDAKAKVEAEKSTMLRQLNAQLVDSVILNAKNLIESNKNHKNKISQKLLEGIRQ